MEKTQKWLSMLGYTLLFIAFINFAAFWIISLSLGGDALNGKIQNGRYYVGNHGRYTEVSKEIWTYSKIHTTSIWVTHPIGIILGAGFVTYSTRKRKNKSSSTASADK